MRDSTLEKIADAHDLERRLIDAVFDYVNEDDERAGLGINAAFRACVALTKASTMSPQTRMAYAQQLFMDMTSDLGPSIIRQSQNH